MRRQLTPCSPSQTLFDIPKTSDNHRSSTSFPSIRRQTTHRLTPCSSCGAEPTLSTSNFISLLPCGHLLCPTCLNSLVNGVSNEAPRPGTCFSDGKEVQSFLGVVFEVGGEAMREGQDQVTVGVQEWRKNVLSSSSSSVLGMGGYMTPPSTPGSVRSR